MSDVDLNLDEIAERVYDARKQAVESGSYDLDGDDHSLTASEQRIVDELTDGEFTFAGHGAARIVLQLGDSVIKFSRYGNSDMVVDGKKQTQFEVDTADNDELLNTPTEVGTDHLWVEYPFKTPLPETDLSDVRKKKALMHVQRELENVPEINAVEIGMENIGYDGENLFVIDFGIPTPDDVEFQSS